MYPFRSWLECNISGKI